MYKYLGWLQKSWIWDVLSLRLYMFFVAKEEDSSRLTISLVTKWASLDRTWEPIAELQEFVWNTLNASLWHLGYWRIIKIWDILVYSRDILIPAFPLKLFLLLLLLLLLPPPSPPPLLLLLKYREEYTVSITLKLSCAFCFGLEPACVSWLCLNCFIQMYLQNSDIQQREGKEGEPNVLTTKNASFSHFALHPRSCTFPD